MIERERLIKLSAGPMPPFVEDLRYKIRAGEKTQTRRVIVPTQTKPHVPPLMVEPWLVDGVQETDSHSKPCWIGKHPNYRTGEKWFSCPYGKVGEIRYLREPIYRGPENLACYKHDGVMVRSGLTGEPIAWRWKKDVLSQLYMPKEMARTFTRYEDIRAEQLQTITAADVLAEGVRLSPKELYPTINTETKLQRNFKWLWDSINAKRGYGWDGGNWWVWVIGWELLVEHTLGGLSPRMMILDDPFSDLSLTDDQKTDLLDWIIGIDFPKPQGKDSIGRIGGESGK